MPPTSRKSLPVRGARAKSSAVRVASMRVYPLTHTREDILRASAYAAELLQRGEVIVYPTDTVYGLGADARIEKGIAKINTIKGRAGETQKPFLIAVADAPMAEEYALWSATADMLARVFLPGPLTLVLPKKNNLPSILTASETTIGIRMPNHPFCLALARALQGPVVSTSVNQTGAAPLGHLENIARALGDRAEEVPCVFDAGILPPSAPSTIVRLLGDTVEVLREGAISKADIEKVLNHMVL